MKYLFVLLYLVGLRRLLLLVVVLMSIAILQQHPVRWRGSSTDATALAPEDSPRPRVGALIAYRNPTIAHSGN